MGAVENVHHSKAEEKGQKLTYYNCNQVCFLNLTAISKHHFFTLKKRIRKPIKRFIEEPSWKKEIM